MKIFVPDASADFCVQTLSAQKCRSPQAQTAHQATSQARCQAACLASFARADLRKPGPSMTGGKKPVSPEILGPDSLDKACLAKTGSGKAGPGKANALKDAAGTALLALGLGLAGLPAGFPAPALASPGAGIEAAPQAMAERAQTRGKVQGLTQGQARGKASDRAIQDALQEASRQSQDRRTDVQAKAEPASASATGFGADGTRAQEAGSHRQGEDGAPYAPFGQGASAAAGEAAASPPGRERTASHASRSSQASLERLLRLAPDARSRQNASQNLRLKVVADTGATLAFQQGFQSRYRELMAACERRARDFDRIFDFQKLILDGRVLPPVIRWTGPSVVVDSPTSATSADATYVIERPARIVAGAPGWREWLMVDAAPFEPDQALLPRTGEERRAWQEAVKEGWTAGRVHAGEIFETAMARLEADYRGMLRFRMLVDARLASAPVLAEGQVALSVMGERLSVNETTFRITLPASFAAAERQPLAGRPGHAALLPD